MQPYAEMVLISACKYSPVTFQLSPLEAIHTKAAACTPCQTDHLMMIILGKGLRPSLQCCQGPDVNDVRHGALEVPYLPILLCSKASTFSLKQQLPAMLQLPAYMHFCLAKILHLTN